MVADRVRARESPRDGLDRRFVLLLVILALAVRALFLVSAYETPLFHAPMVDESWHHQWANELLDNDWSYPQVYFRAPGYPYVLAGVYSLSARSITVARAVQLIISTLSVVLLYLLARRLFEEKIARAAALFMTIYGTLIWYEHALLIPVMIVFLDLLMLYLLVRYRETRGNAWLAAAGLAAGLSLIARPNLAVFIVGAGIWLFWITARKRGMASRILPTLIYWGVALVPVVPVMYHNYVYSGDFIPIASQGGINFYLGNNPRADGLTMQMAELRIDEALSWNEFVPATDSIARHLAGRDLSPGEVGDYWMGRFFDYVLEEPDGFVLGLLRKTYFFFAGVENPDNFDLYFYRRLNTPYAAMVWRAGLHFPFGLISPLAILGAVWLWSRRRQFDLLYLFVLLYAPTVIGVLVTARHRLPVIPIMVLFAAFGAFELVRRLTAEPLKRALIASASAVVLFVFLNTELFGVGFENQRQSHVNLALAYRKLDQTEPMTAHLDSALAIDSGSVVALNIRGLAFMDAGDLYMAKQMFRLALSLDKQSGEIRNNLGTVLRRQGNYESAMLIYNELAVQHPEMPEPVFNMAGIYADRQIHDTALMLYDSVLARDSTYVQAINNKGSVFERMGDTLGAVKLWQSAAAIDASYGQAVVNLVRYHLARQRPDSAAAVLARAQVPWRGSVDWYYLSAQAALAGGNEQTARGLVAESMQAYPDHRPTRSLAGRLGLP